VPDMAVMGRAARGATRLYANRSLWNVLVGQEGGEFALWADVAFVERAAGVLLSRRDTSRRDGSGQCCLWASAR
jgi:hypothetical protein